MENPKPGTIGWMDLTVPDADRVRDFYQSVAGWSSLPVDMGEYHDYAMAAPGGAPVAGVCHRRGPNADLPSVWIIYITVEDLEASLERCRQLGGTVLAPPKAVGPTARYAVIQDPAGAVCALYQA